MYVCDDVCMSERDATQTGRTGYKDTLMMMRVVSNNNDDDDDVNIDKVKGNLDYYASRGKGGMRELVSTLSRYRDPTSNALPKWTKTIRLHGATMNDHADSTLSYLVEHVGCELETRNEDMKNTALHHGILWAAVNAIHYLLFKGADFNSISGDGLNPIALAERRLLRLKSSTELSKEEKDKALEKTTHIVNLLKEISVATSYRKWARVHTKSKHVEKYFPQFVRSESRQKLCVLRRLCLNKRAKMLKKKQYRVKETKRIEKKMEEEERERMKQKPTFPPLPECLEQDGLERGWSRDLKFLDVKTVEDVVTLSLSDVGMLGDLNRTEKRKLWMWIKEKQEKLKDFTTLNKKTKKKNKVVIKAGALRFMDGLRLCICEKKMSEDAFSLIVRYLF